MSGPSSDFMIEAMSLSKSFGRARALADLTFQVRRGEILGFLGPNGAGKTTTMRILTGFLRPNAGTVRVAGVDVADSPLAARRRIGYLPENAPLYGDMMVCDFLRYVAKLREVPAARRKERLERVASRCGLADVLGKDIRQLSKGFRQRVGLAQAMLHDPDLLILDEPTSGLDPNQIVEIRALIKDLGKDKTVILSTHILPEVQATCNRILIIHEGRLVADDTPEGLSAAREAGALIHLLVKGADGTSPDSSAIREVFAALPGVLSVQVLSVAEAGCLGLSIRAAGPDDPRERLFRQVVKSDLVLLELRRERVSLEDTFRKLTLGEGAGHV